MWEGQPGASEHICSHGPGPPVPRESNLGLPSGCGAWGEPGGREQAVSPFSWQKSECRVWPLRCTSRPAFQPLAPSSEMLSPHHPSCLFALLSTGEGGVPWEMTAPHFLSAASGEGGLGVLSECTLGHWGTPPVGTHPPQPLEGRSCPAHRMLGLGLTWMPALGIGS